MRPRPPARSGERGAALIVVALLAAALSTLAGAIAWFALMAIQVSAAARATSDVDAAMQAGIEIAAGSLAGEPDLAAVRSGAAIAAISGTSRLDTRDGAVDVPALGRELESRRRRLRPPADRAVWRPYLWGRLGELLATPIGTSDGDPLVVVWVRADDAAGLGPDRLELAVEGVGRTGARARAIAVLAIGVRGVRILAVRPEAGLAGPG